MTNAQTAIAGLEEIYDALALAIDDAPADERELRLAKVALLLAHEIDDPQRVIDLIGQASRRQPA
ncbi:DUF2783 domain-containing protein [Pandoraea nosoerga]|uniref:DUF2783 domain-containing protein n=1 Tax=Pandoraea nosoerga TaxID=2508296 RepID=A0A5E4S0A6_9BURK|nr:MULTISPECIES: DUF2783 domain-containing protein [Pandoraea]MBN4667706.1 DUF2783 domain-containing protein [Pandoraea nosoerga]MBN4677995.1 DUF2783 domain-containing protein [Pandoraea nosoerga]MBN4679500.1 DUF2783 domain-containing protein [Pandoraea nosoerga]MBN4743411.1 DUF2783 domain-containing protein [Pandoraea nosoerga]VVD68553.1 hypothetical protein PNO31109_00475 [Pandoraea nosoerga]